MAQVVGARSTSQAITNENILIREVGDKIALLEPNEAPLITFMNKAVKNRRAVQNPKVEWYEDDYVERWAVNSTATVAAATASVTITVSTGHGVRFVPGDLLIVPNAVSSSTKPEMIRVTARSSDTLTVVRNVGGAGLAAINPGVAIRILGSAAEEGATPPNSKTTIKENKFTYTEIFRTSFEFTKTQVASAAYGISGSERRREQRKKLVEHKIKLNSAALWGYKSQDLTGGPNGYPIRTTDGINNVISTNVVDAGGVLTRKTFEEFAETAFRYGSRTKLLLAAPKIISAFNQWGNSFMQVTPGEKKYGVKVSTIHTGHGDFMLVRDWMLEHPPSGGTNGFGGTAFAIDIDECEYVYLSGNGENRDTRLKANVVNDGRDSYVDEYLTECGFCFKQEKWHSKLYNVTDYSS